MHDSRTGRVEWRCPVCDGRSWAARFATRGGAVDANGFVPSSDQFGQVAGQVVACRACGHGSLLELPPADAVDVAYHDAEDPVSLEEEGGQMATSDRDLGVVERHASPGRLLDLGCWTGSFVLAAQRRGWASEGIEPSRWAVARAHERGASVRQATLDEVDLDAGSYRAVVACDVLEHLFEPGAALDRIRDALEPGGIVFLTVPDAGSALARAMGHRWWAVLPMHVQYFTRRSMRLLLERHGFEVRDLRTHPKVFSARYYADRLASFIPGAGRLVPPAVKRFGLADRPVAPDLRDRMAVVAARADGAAA